MGVTVYCLSLLSLASCCLHARLYKLVESSSVGSLTKVAQCPVSTIESRGKLTWTHTGGLDSCRVPPHPKNRMDSITINGTVY